MNEIIIALYVAVLWGSAICAGEPGPMQAVDDAHLTTEERSQALQLLLDSHKEFLDAVEPLSDAQWSYKPAPDRWSVAEVAEHLMLAEGRLFAAVQAALARDPNPDWKARTAGKAALLERALLNRQARAQAPESIQPTGTLARAEILARFREARSKTVEFIKATNLPLKAHTLDHPFPFFGTLSAYQWLLYIPLHNLRHHQQIVEITATPGFPP